MKKEQDKLPVDKELQSSEVSRRDFLVGTGTVVVGGAIGAGLLSSCKDGTTTTVTQTTTKTVPTTVTTTSIAGAGETITITAGTGQTVTNTVTKTVTSGTGGAIEPWQEPETTVINCFGLGGSGGDPCAVDVKNGKIVRIRPLHYDEKYTEAELPETWHLDIRGKTLDPLKMSIPSFHAFQYKKRIYNPKRVAYPLQRVDWEPGGDPAKINAQNRGKSKYKRISWDEATTIVASEIKRVKEKYGPYAVLNLGEDGHHESKNFHAVAGLHNLLLSKYGGYTREIRNADSWEGHYWGAKHVWGGETTGTGVPSIQGWQVAENAEMLLWFGRDPETTDGQTTCASARMNWYITECGVKIVHVDPLCNYGAVYRGPGVIKWIPVYPNTDGALLLAIMWTWIDEDTYDKEYVATHTVGMDKMQAYIMGDDDGVAKTPKWAAPLCGVQPWTIKALAREWAAKRTSGRMSGNARRGPYSHEPTRLSVVAWGMQGLGAPGRSSLYEVSTPGSKIRLGTGAIAFALAGNKVPQFIPRTQTHHAILDGHSETWGDTAIGSRCEDQFIKYTYPIPASEGGSKVHMFWSEKPCNISCWNDGFRFIRAIRTPEVECFVCNHQWLEDDDLFSDIILPVTTCVEDLDIMSSGREKICLALRKPAIEHVGEAKSDYEIAAEIAKKLGTYDGKNVYDEFTGGKTIEEWIKFGYEKSGVADQVSWEELNEKGYYVLPVADYAKQPEGMTNFYKDPVGNPLTTPTGLLEFYSQRLADNFPDDEERPPLPKWVPGMAGAPGYTHDESLWGERAKAMDHPLLCVSNHPRWRHHSQLDNTPWLREIPSFKIKGKDGYMYEPVWINPVEAAQRGIKQADIVKVTNHRGTFLGAAYVTERMMHNSTSVDHGAMVDEITEGLDRGGSSNLNTPEGPVSQHCWGMATTAFLVEVEKVTEEEMGKWKDQYPEAFARDYNPGYGVLGSAWIEGGSY